MRSDGLDARVQSHLVGRLPKCLSPMLVPIADAADLAPERASLCTSLLRGERQISYFFLKRKFLNLRLEFVLLILRLHCLLCVYVSCRVIGRLRKA